MGTTTTVLFLTLLNWILVSADTSDIFTASNIQESHKTILADINYQLELNQAIPGKPDQDYPIHNAVPKTTFSCNGKLEGYYADIESRCQAFRICTNTATSTQGFGFLCPNGTLFSQKFLVCDWYRNVKCNDSELYYNNNNIEVGTEINIMKTIRLMMEYPINMLKGDYTRYTEEPYAKLKDATKQETSTRIFYDYENPNPTNGSSLLINNLGELSPDNSINYVENGTAPINTLQSSTISEINLALHINNLAETETINGTVHKDSDTINKQPFRFLSQEFSTQKIQNKDEYEKENQPVNLNSLHDNDQLKYRNTNKNTSENVEKNSAKSNLDIPNLDVEHDLKIALEISNATQITSTNQNSSIDTAKYDTLKGNSEYLQNYSSNLLISGIIQTSIEPKINEHNATVKPSKHFKNFFTKRNLHKTFVTTPKMSSTSTTKSPRYYYKQTVGNRLQPLISQTSSTKEKSKLEHYSISKKSIRNTNTGSANLSNIINHGSDLIYQPTLESVQKNLKRYQVSNGDLIQNSGRFYPNRKKAPSHSIVAGNKEKQTLTLENNTKHPLINIPTYRNSFVQNDDINTMTKSSNDEFYQDSSPDSFLYNQQVPSILETQLNKENSSGFSQELVIAGAQELPITSDFQKSYNINSKSSSPKNYISLKEFFNRKFGDKAYIQ